MPFKGLLKAISWLAEGFSRAFSQLLKSLHMHFSRHGDHLRRGDLVELQGRHKKQGKSKEDQMETKENLGKPRGKPGKP